MFSNKLICNILRFIDDNINRKISICEFEECFFYNRYYIMKLFKREIGVSIVNYINYIRIYNCLNEIRDSNYSMLRIGLNNGFYSLEYFSEMFKSVMGVSPSIYKQFLNDRGVVDNKKRINIISNVVFLRELVSKKKMYLDREKPDKIMMKKLTIFK